VKPRTGVDSVRAHLLPARSLIARVASASVEAVTVPPRSPRANAYAKWFLLSSRTEGTGRMPIFSQRHQRPVLAEYARTSHRGRQLRPLRSNESVADLYWERTKRCPVLDGLIEEASEPRRSPGQGQ
jgi:putative transposase